MSLSLYFTAARRFFAYHATAVAVYSDGTLEIVIPLLAMNDRERSVAQRSSGNPDIEMVRAIYDPARPNLRRPAPVEPDMIEIAKRFKMLREERLHGLLPADAAIDNDVLTTDPDWSPESEPKGELPGDRWGVADADVDDADVDADDAPEAAA